MQTRDIRQKFLDFFNGYDHEIVSSSSLVPHDDPTLLFTNAGMVQFKDVFTGIEKRDYNKATTSQRCVRAGGKHNDLDNVGYTARHHTFFEMLGNFSFGDYFKEVAIERAWELLTVGYGLPEDKLWVTVFEEDDEAADIWMKKMGVPESRFARIGAHDNFWAMGDTGPCGPCTEIFFDHGPDVAGGPPGTPEEDGDRYIEIWNLVFMQFNKAADGTMSNLPAPSVDTGMGLERLAAILQGVHSNYEIDLFQNLIGAASEVTGIEDREDKSLRVIADHIRSTGFLIADGVMPSNEGRGYVLRRIIRRAIRHGYQSGGEARFMHKLVQPLVDEMGDAFPELREAAPHVERVLAQEGDRFAETLDQGLKILDAEVSNLDGKTIPGDVVFKLYDTYGFPIDLTADVAREQGLEIDTKGFEAEMEGQRTRARAASQFGSVEKVSVENAGTSEFDGYDHLEITDAKIMALVSGTEQADRLAAGADGVVVLQKTPFYAESGGQVGDQGVIRSGEGGVFVVSDTQKLPGGAIGHYGRLTEGEMSVGAVAQASVDADLRAVTINNHSATHLLHAALQQVLGDHVQQKGSLVAPDRLRFDFSHFEPVSGEQIASIESIVNNEIRANHPIEVAEMNIDDAKAGGAAALFGEKYDDVVRTIRMGSASFELCGGTHVDRTGDIGLMKIISETGVAAGIRRIEALTGPGAFEYLSDQSALIDRLAENVKTGRDDVEDKITQMVKRNRELERELEQLRAQAAVAGSGSDPMDEAKEVAGVKTLVLRRDGVDPKALRSMMDQLKNKLGSGVVVIGSVRDDKVSVIAGVTKDLAPGVHAGKLVGSLTEQLGGKGGGKPELGQGGGTDVAGLDAALDSVTGWLESNA